MKIITSLVLAAALGAPAVAFAGPYGEAAEAIPMSEPAQVHVTNRGLDLSQPHDAAVMLNRISSAALEACGASDFSIPEYRRSVVASDCYRGGVADAVRQLNAPGVNALYGQGAATTLLAAN